MIDQLQIIADTGLAILIWLVQLIIYPSFSYIEAAPFKQWHNRYVRLISVVVSPLILLQLMVEVVHIFGHDLRWHRIVLIALVLTSTYLFSVPAHRSLGRVGKEISIIAHLVLTNWIRTFIWTLLFVDTAYLHLN